jgi:hypothetical protein
MPVPHNGENPALSGPLFLRKRRCPPPVRIASVEDETGRPYACQNRIDPPLKRARPLSCGCFQAPTRAPQPSPPTERISRSSRASSFLVSPYSAFPSWGVSGSPGECRHDGEGMSARHPGWCRFGTRPEQRERCCPPSGVPLGKWLTPSGRRSPPIPEPSSSRRILLAPLSSALARRAPLPAHETRLRR